VYLFGEFMLPFGFVLQIAISASNTGGAWDNAKKYIEVNIKVIISEVAGIII
jgi:Na+/H+-translocating membrane pyrophosphatase